MPSLHLDDPVSQALDLMADFHVTHLPVVTGDKLAGLVSEEDLLNIEDDGTLLSVLQPGFSAIVAHAEAYFYEAVQLVNENGLTLIPVVGGESEYSGSIIATDLLRQLGRVAGVNEFLVLSFGLLNRHCRQGKPSHGQGMARSLINDRYFHHSDAGCNSV